MTTETAAAAEAAPTTPTSPYEQFVALLGRFSAASQRLEFINLRINRRLLQETEKVRDTYTEISTEISQLEAEIERLCRANPTWFAETKQLKTPFGVAALTKVTDLVVLDEDNTFRLLDREKAKTEARRQEQLRTSQPVEDEFDPELYVRRKTELNIEALERLDDARLSRLGISREPRQSFSVKAAKVDLGKAIKRAAKEKGEEG